MEPITDLSVTAARQIADKKLSDVVCGTRAVVDSPLQAMLVNAELEHNHEDVALEDVIWPLLRMERTVCLLRFPSR